MKCKKCGEQNEEKAKFCVKCGTALEEKKVEVKEKTKEEKDKEEQAKKDNKAAIIIIGIVVGVALLGVIAYFAFTFLIGMFAVKTTEKVVNNAWTNIQTNNSTSTTTNTSSDQILPEFKYTIPTQLVPASYNSKTLGFFKSDSSNLCSLTIWNISYVANNATAESIMTSHSSISNASELTPSNTRINGKDWTTYTTTRYGTKYSEFGRFSSDGKNFYMIKYADYKPDTGICNKYLNQFLKTVKSK